MDGRTAGRSHIPEADQMSLGLLPLPTCLLDAQGCVLEANSAWGEAFGTDMLPGSAPGHDDLRERLRWAAGFGDLVGIEVTVRSAGGEQRSFAGRCGPVELPGSPEVVALCSLVDITRIRQHEAQLTFMATHDLLTGLPNRRMFEDALSRSLARARRSGPGALIMLDVDNLKSYNDALGHASGDQALINVSLLLQTHVRAGDMLARIGGDEFGVILEASTLEEAAEISERMRHAASEEAFVADARTYDLGLSAGVVPFGGGEDPADLMEAADAALYEAKNAGRDRVVVKDVLLAPAMPAGPRVTTEVRSALSDGRIHLAYQPVIRLDDGSVEYFESLGRIVAKSGELLLPAAFLGTMDRLGLVSRFTRVAVERVVEEVSASQQARASVNLSGADLLDRSFPGYIGGLLSEHGVGVERLLFEVAEPVAVLHRDALKGWFERMGAVGCDTVLDRFGGGSESLSLISGLPFSQVKYDVSSCERAAALDESAEYLRALRRIVEALGPDFVASHVEDETVLEFARKAGCSLVQGYGVGPLRDTLEE